MKLREYDNCRRTRGSRRVPRSVQQSIPIDTIYSDGVWRSGDVYSRMWSVSDVNYAMLSDAAKKEIQTLYGTVYAGIPADCWTQFCVTSQRMDEAAFRRDILLPMKEERTDAYRSVYNALLESRVRGTCASHCGKAQKQKPHKEKRKKHPKNKSSASDLAILPKRMRSFACWLRDLRILRSGCVVLHILRGECVFLRVGCMFLRIFMCFCAFCFAARRCRKTPSGITASAYAFFCFSKNALIFFRISSGLNVFSK